MATSTSINALARRTALVGILERDGRVLLEPASAELGVSLMTIRRDLEALERDGVVRRVRGGAVPAPRARSFNDRMASRSEAKQTIAAKARELVPRTGAAAFDASSTSGTLLSQIDNVDELMVCTNSYENLAIARRVSGITPILTGGEPDPRTDSFVGPIACDAASSLRYSHFFTSAAALTEATGTFEVSLPEAQVKRAFVDSADETIVLVDSTKLEQTALARAITWTKIDVLVTDLDTHDARLAPFRTLTHVV